MRHVAYRKLVGCLQLEALFVDLGAGRAAVGASDFDRVVTEALVDRPDGQARCPHGHRQLPQLTPEAQLSLADLHEWWRFAALGHSL